MLTFMFWLIATPVLLILIGALWIWLLRMVLKMLTGA